MAGPSGVKRPLPKELCDQLEEIREKISKVSGNIFDLDKNKKRWLLIGIGLHTILSPTLREYVEPKLEALRKTRYRHHKDAVSLSKTFLRANMTKYSAFDESCDASALLGIMINSGICSQSTKQLAAQVRSDIRNDWAHCNYREWTDVKYKHCQKLCDQFVHSLGLDKQDERQVIAKLYRWNNNGQKFIDETSPEYSGLPDIKRNVQDLVRCVKTFADTPEQIDKIQKELSTIDLVLMDHTERIEQLEKETKLTKDKVIILCNEKARQENKVAEKRQIHIDEWKKDEEFFTVTRASEFVTKLIKKKNVVVVTGSSGSGKSSIIHHVALELETKEGYEIIPAVNSPEDIIDHRDINKDQVFVIDDFCGKSFINDQALQTWREREEEIKKYFPKAETKKEAGNMKILVSCRLQISNDKKFKNLKMFTDTSCNLESKEHNLTPKEKLLMLKRYTHLPESKIIFLLTEYPYPYFPFICKISKNKDFFEVSKLFSAPVDSIRKDINIVIESKSYEFCALVLCILFEGGFNEAYVDSEEIPEVDKQKLRTIVANFNINLDIENHRNELLVAFQRLEGTYITKIGSHYTITHDKLMDIVVVSCGSKLVRHFIDFLPISLIVEKLRFRSVFPKIDENKDTEEDLFLFIPEKEEKRYFKRFFQSFQESFFQNPQLMEKTFRDKIMNYIMQNEEMCKESFGILKAEFLKLDYNAPQKHSYLSTPLIEASKIGFVELVEFLLSINCDINTKDSIGYTPLYYSCINGHLSVVQLLIKIGGDIQELLNQYPVLVRNVCKNGHIEIFNIFLETNINVTKYKEICGSTSLYAACEGGHTDIVRILLDNNVDPLECDEGGKSPFYVACVGGHYDTVRFLLDKDIYPSKRVDDEFSPLYAACEGGHTDIVRLLLDKNVIGPSDLVVDGSSLMFAACEGGHIDIVRLLLDKNVDPSRRAPSLFSAEYFGLEEEGLSPFYAACQEGHTDIVRLLLEKNVDPSERVADGSTPLFTACQEGHIDIVRLLLGKNVNPKQRASHTSDSDEEDEEGPSPFYAACEAGHIDIVKLLLVKGADPINYYENGGSPFYAACDAGHIDIVKLLLDEGADPSETSVDGYSSFYAACKSGHIDIVRLLLDVCPDDYLYETRSALRAAFVAGHIDIVRLLFDFSLDNDDDPSQWYDDGYTLLFAACETGYTDIVRRLLDKNVDPLVNMYGYTSLLIACKGGYTDIVSLLLDKNVDQAQDVKLYTPLHVACEWGQTDVVQLLLNKNVDPSLRTSDGKTALDFAANDDIKDLLMNHKS